MKKKYIIIILSIILLIVILTLFLVEIPSPSKLISENYELKIQ